MERKQPLTLLLCLFVMTSAVFARQKDPLAAKHILVIHGGAGTILKKNMTPEKERAYREALTEALQAGYAVLKSGGKAIDAVETSVRIMEDCPLFNAGKGAVFTHEGVNEMDAAIMDGSTRQAGSVSSVTTIKNPISAARAVMEKSEHVMLSGSGADQFAKSQGLTRVDPSYFRTEERWKGLERAREQDSIILDHDSLSISGLKPSGYSIDQKFGTVGAVALDQQGGLAAATSTGGMTNKKFGRIGDAPIIGAGTYANNLVAVSCTGWGEFFIRNVVAYDIAAQMEYGNETLARATENTLEKVEEMGGDGGLIALDKNGHFVYPFNTSGMYRGVVTSDGDIQVEIYR